MTKKLTILIDEEAIKRLDTIKKKIGISRGKAIETLIMQANEMKLVVEWTQGK